ncbi:MAG: helix-turn-helix transcriptional regulator [Saccharopolyspora sp.]|uniref:helix-turn-helix transcriptional regulator n=1 Tax=unclassified Saccharopolyspora TaxID=2646250 RepID=UPI0025CF0F8B|nr:helix-turn-helix transcriptional regulator [Saccharopolyspora sp.]MBQ6639548.1 helix-turn-helix transcriptional regulator [Saccharopolyspora sp.]
MATEGFDAEVGETFSQRLRWLFDNVPAPGADKDRRWEVQEAAARVGVSRATLSAVLNGHHEPKLPVARALADLFGVGLEFFDATGADARQHVREVQALALLGRANVEEMAFRHGHEVAAEDLEVFLNVAKALRSKQQRDDPAE